MDNKWNSCKELFRYLCLSILYDQLSTLVEEDITKNAESHFLSVLSYMDNEVGIENILSWKDIYEEDEDEDEDPIGYLMKYLSTMKNTIPNEYNSYMIDVALALVNQVNK